MMRSRYKAGASPEQLLQDLSDFMEWLSSYDIAALVDEVNGVFVDEIVPGDPESYVEDVGAVDPDVKELENWEKYQRQLATNIKNVGKLQAILSDNVGNVEDLLNSWIDKVDAARSYRRTRNFRGVSRKNLYRRSRKAEVTREDLANVVQYLYNEISDLSKAWSKFNDLAGEYRHFSGQENGPLEIITPEELDQVTKMRNWLEQNTNMLRSDDLANIYDLAQSLKQPIKSFATYRGSKNAPAMYRKNLYRNIAKRAIRRRLGY